MPLTPFHIGPSACIALASRKYIDFPVFILVNFIIDLEPLAVMILDLNYPVHGYFHTLLFGVLIGGISAVLFYLFRNILKKIMGFLHLPYETNFRKMLISAVLGFWFHVLLDSFLYSDIRPFYPFKVNPFFGKIGYFAMYLFCTVLFIVAVIMYKKSTLKSPHTKYERRTTKR